jgi:dihydrolipoamide dehydrogenase
VADKFDLAIIGGGPGGYAAALYAGAAGLKVALVERDKVGGTCLHRGCIPAKELLETAHVFRTVAEAKEFGVQADAPIVDFSISQARKQKIIDQLHKGLSGLLKSRKVTTFEGTGTLGANRTVTVSGGSADGTTFTADHVILASGSAVRTIPGFDIDGKIVMTSDEVLAMDKLPQSAVVIGGGAIGCEFASMLSDLGAQVTVLEALPQMLTGCDTDVVDVVARSFRRRGIDVRTGVTVNGHTPGDGGTTVSFGEGEQVTADVVVMSVGRRPVSDSLGLDDTAVEVNDRGFVEVDEYLQTAEPGVYAVGDLISVKGMNGPHPALAHVGFAEAIIAVKHLLGEDPLPLDYTGVPWCIYCYPEVAFAGLSEQAAKAAGYDVVVSKHKFAGNGRAMIIGETDGMVKVIAEKTADGKAGRILGVHMVGPWVTEQLGAGYLSVNWEATPDDLAHLIQPHPTLTEMFGETVMSLTGRGLHG